MTSLKHAQQKELKDRVEFQVQLRKSQQADFEMTGLETTKQLNKECKRLRKQVQVKDSLIEILTSEKMKLTLRLNDKIKEIGQLQSKLMDLEYKTAKISI